MVLVLALMVVGCAFRNHMNAGDKYFGQGMYEEALAEYEAALRIDPDSEHAQVKVKQTREKVAGEWTDDANAKLAAGDHLAAIEISGKAFKLTPNNSEIQSLVSQVATASADQADTLATQELHFQGFQLYDAMTVQLPEEHAQISGRFEAFKQGWAVFLSDRGVKAEEEGRHGEALLLWSKAATLSNDPRFRQRRDELRKELRQVYAYRVFFDASSKDAVFTKLFPRIANYTGPQNLFVMDLDAKSKEAHAVFKLTLGKVSFKDIANSSQRSGEYQSGTKQVENPAYTSRQDDVVRTEKDLLNAERNRDEVQQKLDRAKQNAAGDDPNDNVSTMAEQDVQRYSSELDSAYSKVESARNALQSARDALASTPATIDEPVYSTHTYTVKTHTVSGSLPVRGEIVHNDDRKAIAFQTAVNVSASDETHDAQNLLNLPADPLQLPSKDALTSDVHTKAFDLVISKMLESFSDYRATLLTKAFATEDNLKVDTLALYILLDPSSVDPSVTPELERLRGISNPVEVLTAP